MVNIISPFSLYVQCSYNNVHIINLKLVIYLHVLGLLILIHHINKYLYIIQFARYLYCYINKIIVNKISPFSLHVLCLHNVHIINLKLVKYLHVLRLLILIHHTNYSIYM